MRGGGGRRNKNCGECERRAPAAAGTSSRGVSGRVLWKCEFERCDSSCRLFSCPRARATVELLYWFLCTTVFEAVSDWPWQK